MGLGLAGAWANLFYIYTYILFIYIYVLDNNCVFIGHVHNTFLIQPGGGALHTSGHVLTPTVNVQIHKHRFDTSPKC